MRQAYYWQVALSSYETEELRSPSVSLENAQNPHKRSPKAVVFFDVAHLTLPIPNYA